MQPYIYYGFGFRSSDLPKAVRQRLIDESDIFTWFTEDTAGSSEDDAGVFYIECVSPWDEHSQYTESHSVDFKSLEGWKGSFTQEDLDVKLDEYGLTEYREHLKFYVSVTEI